MLCLSAKEITETKSFFRKHELYSDDFP